LNLFHCGDFALKRFLVPLLLSVSSVAMVAPVFAETTAQAAQPVRIELKALRISTENGKETSVEAKQARPGDMIEYRAAYTNTSKSVVKGLVATLPIPADMQYTGVAMPVGAEASTDGKSFAAIPLIRQVGGKAVEVPLSEYRALRWRVASLPVGKSVVVSARARVNGISQ
jgi:uncharacterized repeat protein (TIGR01451 family)